MFPFVGISAALLFFHLFFPFFLFQYPPLVHGTPSTLRHIQLFFRHGQRIPTSFLTFPSEPDGTDMVKDFPYELGEMTFEGIWQEYLLGQSLRQLYGRHLGSKYRSREILVYSGRDNRTANSAQLVLAGLFPPKDGQVWNPSLRWQPIPVETVSILDHVSFGVFDHCPAETEKLMRSEGYGRLEERYAREIADLQDKTGVNITSLDIFQKVLDSIVSRGDLSKLLPLPSWASEPHYFAHIKRTKVELHEGLIDLFVDEMGGWHLDQLLGRMDDAVGGRSQEKTVLYSAHDTNFLTLARFLDIDVIDDIMPDYASLLAFELHQEANGGGYFVEVKFRSGLNGTLSSLNIRKCATSPCRFQQFRSIGRRVTSDEWLNQCGQNALSDPSGDDPADCTTYRAIAASLIVLVVLMFGSILSLLASCCSYKRRYMELVEANEQTPLLTVKRLNRNG